MTWILSLWIVWGGMSPHRPQEFVFANEAACYKALANLKVTVPEQAADNEWIAVALCSPEKKR